jgi:cytidylate kinase
MDSLQLNRAQAQALIKREDHARRSYVKQHFHCDIDDPASYDLILRTDHWSDAGAAACIVEALEQLNPT